MIWIFASIPMEVSANTESILLKERSEVRADLTEQREKMQMTQAELLGLEEEINFVNEVIEANEKQITETEENIQEVEVEILEIQVEIDTLETDIERRGDLLKGRISSMQRSGGKISYLEVLFGSKSFSDFIDRISLVTRITQSDQKLIEELEADQDKILVHKKTFDEKLSELEDTKLELNFIQELTLEQKEEHELKQEELVEKRKEFEAIINELEVEERDITRMINEARQAAEREAAARRINSMQVSNKTQTRAPSHLSASTGKGNSSAIINAGNRYLNGRTAYKYAGGRTSSDIANGLFDCSGYVSWAFGQGGINIPKSTDGIARIGTKVSASQMMPGDIVFFNTYKTNGHVGIYIGNGQFIGSQSSTGVAIANMTSGYWKNNFSGHVRRVIN